MVHVAHRREDPEAHATQAQEEAKFCENLGVDNQEIMGSVEYLERLIEVASAPELIDDIFIVVPTGSELRQDHFV